MSSFNYQLAQLVSAGAISYGQHYGAPSIAHTDSTTLCPSPSFNVHGNDMQQVPLPNSQDSHQFFSAQYARAVASRAEPERSTGDLSNPGYISQIIKLEGTSDTCRRDEHSQRSDISWDQPMAEVCSSATEAEDMRFQSMIRLLAMQTAEAEEMERANVKVDMRAEKLSRIDHTEPYPQVIKPAASVLANGISEDWHINMSAPSSLQQQFTAGHSTTRRDSRNFANNMAANAACKELLLLNRVQAAANVGAIEISNNSILQHCSSAAAYEARNAGGVDLNAQHLLLRSSLLANNHDSVADPMSKGPCTQQLSDQAQMAADGRHQFGIVANTNPHFPLEESYSREGSENLFTSSQRSFVQQQAVEVETPYSSYSCMPSRQSAIIANSELAFHSAGHNAAGMFSQPSISPLLPIVDGAAGALARYIQPEDLSLGRKSSDFLSLDLTYSRSGPVSVLRTSKYLKPAQQLLEEFCNVKQETNSTASDSSARSAVLEGAKEISHYSKVESSAAKLQLSAEDRCYLQMRKARLVGMVEELDRRYQRYQDQMQLIITSFESATGMSAAVPYTALARKLISRQFRALRDAIGEHIKVACRSLGEDISSVPVLNKGETPRLRILDQRLRHHRTLQQVGMLHQTQSWRPQRGLPERSVAVLRAWLFEHFLHPYPKDSEKLMLARLTGLTRSQVANWFINARVRLWKPMVEQMYAEESKENEFQDAAEGSVAVQNGQLDHMDYTGSDGHFGKGDMVQAKDNSGARHNHDVENSEHLSYDSGNSTMSYNRMMTPRHGVSLTLGLQHSSSSTEFPLHPNYNANQHFNVQAASAEDVNYTFV